MQTVAAGSSTNEKAPKGAISFVHLSGDGWNQMLNELKGWLELRDVLATYA